MSAAAALFGPFKGFPAHRVWGKVVAPANVSGHGPASRSEGVGAYTPVVPSTLLEKAQKPGPAGATTPLSVTDLATDRIRRLPRVTRIGIPFPIRRAPAPLDIPFDPFQCRFCDRPAPYLTVSGAGPCCVLDDLDTH